MVLAQRAAPEAGEGCVSDWVERVGCFWLDPSVISFVIQVLVI